MIKEYLLSYKSNKKDIDYLIEKYNQLHEEALTIGGFDYSAEKVVTSVKFDAAYTTIINQCRDIEKEICRRRSEWFKLGNDIEDMIDTIPSLDVRLVLRYRYILLKETSDIARHLCRSESSIKQLQRQGIEFLEQNN